MPPPSRQERRKAERDAAKRGPAKAGAAGAAAARANVHPLGDWRTQTADPNVMFDAIGPANVSAQASAGDRDAQYSQGYRIMSNAGGASGGPLGGAGRSQLADVVLPLAPQSFLSLTRLRCVGAVSPEV